jgi:glycosyltransferase involved in cell wall biosynthesis
VNNLQPLVSVGIPTYNNPDGLRKVLGCITNQSYQNLEVIVSINASPNHETNLENMIICKEWHDNDPRVTWYFQMNNIGADENFRFVRKKSTGKYLMTAQDDDWWSNTYIENLVGALEDHPDIPLACCPSMYISSDGRKSDVHPLNHLSVFNAVGNGDLGLATQGIWRRECMIEIPYTPNRVLGIEHVLASIILLKYGEILVINSELYMKGLTPGKFGDCFKYEPFYAFGSWWYMMKTLAQSPIIPDEQKMVLPIIALTNFVRALGITGVQMIISLPDNPIKSIVQQKFFGAN